MRVVQYSLILVVVAVSGCAAEGELQSGAEVTAPVVQLAPFMAGLDFNLPVALVFPESSAETGYIVEQSGRILSVHSTNGLWAVNEVLNIEGRVNDRGREEGLLGLALSPNFEANPYIYVNYTASNPRRTVISRFAAGPFHPVVADETSEEVILEVAQPYSNHNGGHLAFGPDGYLYIGFGDGGSAGDPRSNGQDPGTHLGTIVRIDVSDADSTRQYTVPAGNPFVGAAGAKPEVWAFGLRNPWRFSFDRLTGDLWAADVGQNEREEVDLIRPGLNYGWNVMEGSLCFGRRDQDCSSEGLELPLTEYGREGGCSVTGGHVYRGRRVPELYGSYIFGDFCSGKIWSYAQDTDQTTLLTDSNLRISTFGEDHDGELYVVSLDGGIYALVNDEERQ